MDKKPRPGWHFAALIGVLLALIIIPFLIWGERFDGALSLEGTRQWMAQYGAWAWLAGIGLLVGDILLPIPSTVVMSALGLSYGWWWGGLISAGGSITSGVVAYGLCRAFGRPAAHWIAGADGLQRGEELFAQKGGWLVALSRWTPVLPEAVSCLAGLVRMPWRTYLGSLVCGSVPLGFAFAAIGHLGQDRPGLAIALSAIVPILLWAIATRWIKRPAGKN
ncbi:MAG: TVP38/TMEM64 family protein [Verrucomicrobiales bacterium]|nr:TVP38/TMEM64 family protein [Verrucomicrobiales bacterium]MCP5556307.1 TVP38/TMEM64 family protein [Verrucomicrobiaceae bacterium]